MVRKEMKSDLSRRDFIKTTAVGVGATAMAGISPKEAKADTLSWDYEADVVVVGCGFAAQAAALEAADAGAKVIVLEKAPKEHAGGSSHAKVNFNSASVGATKQAAIEYLRSQCWGTAEDETIVASALAPFDLPPWIESLGGYVEERANPASYPTIPGGAEWGSEAPSLARFIGYAPKKYQDMLAAGTINSPWQTWMMEELFPARGITLMCSTPATELVQDPDTKRILGVKALTGVTFNPNDYTKYYGGRGIAIKAKKGVVLGCGGYENNWQILDQFGPHGHSAYVTFYGSPYSTGDGIIMATKVGAQLWHMNKTETHNWATTVGSKQLGCGRPVNAWATGIARGPGIVVNRDGKRFLNEYHNGGHSEDEEGRSMRRFEHKLTPADDYNFCDYRNLPFYWIFDDTTMKAGALGSTGHWAGVLGIHKWSKDNSYELAQGWFIKADTIEALAKQVVVKDFFGRVVGMDATGLVATVNQYNQFCAAGKDEEYGRRPSTLAPLVTPPFYLMEVCECQTNTQGGPKHNKNSQVLDNDNQPIPGLYAGGETGSIYGGLYNGAGNLAEALAMGRVAGRHVATLQDWD